MPTNSSMIRKVVQNGHGSVQLLGKQDSRKVMWEREMRKGDCFIDGAEKAPVNTVRPPDDKIVPRRLMEKSLQMPRQLNA